MADQKQAVQSQLDQWGPKVIGTALAALALGLAERLDDEECPATAYASIARELHSVLADLSALAPPAADADGVDEIRAARERRRGVS